MKFLTCCYVILFVTILLVCHGIRKFKKECNLAVNILKIVPKSTLLHIRYTKNMIKTNFLTWLERMWLSMLYHYHLFDITIIWNWNYQMVDLTEYPTFLKSSWLGYNYWLTVISRFIVCIHLRLASSFKTWDTLGAFLRTVMLSIATPKGHGAFPIDKSMYLSLAWIYYLTKQQFIMW